MSIKLIAIWNPTSVKFLTSSVDRPLSTLKAIYKDNILILPGVYEERSPMAYKWLSYNKLSSLYGNNEHQRVLYIYKYDKLVKKVVFANGRELDEFFASEGKAIGGSNGGRKANSKNPRNIKRRAFYTIHSISKETINSYSIAYDIPFKWNGYLCILKKHKVVGSINR